MSSTHRETVSPDGRFVLRYRCKDSWGDHAMRDERWQLMDARFDCRVAAWHNEGDDEFETVELAGDREVHVRRSDGTTEVVVLPVPRTLAPEEVALREAVFAAPEDPAPRSVYADWLLARGEPRGELIASQLAGLDAAALLARHRLAFLCDDALPLTRDAVFVHGFVEELGLQVFDPEVLARLLEVPATACLRRLDLSYSRDGDRLVALLASAPRLARLRRVDLFCSDVTEPALARLRTARPQLVAALTAEAR